MTYADREVSAYDGQPNELFTFLRSGAVWRYTSGDEDIVAESFTYTAIPMERSKIEQTQEAARSAIDIVISKTAEFVQQYISYPPTAVVSLTIKRYHVGLAEYVTVWVGRVINVSFTEKQATIRCEPIQTTMKRPILRLVYQPNCPHVLYGSACTVNRSIFALNATLSGVSANVLSSSAFGSFSANYFAGGYVTYNNGISQETRFITSSISSDITLNVPFNSIPSNADVTVYPGCDHTLQTCNDKFGNVLNYGGQPFYPGRNPFGGNPIF